MSSDSIASTIINNFEDVKKHRHNFDTIYDDISEFVQPNRGDFQTQTSPGSRTDARVFDNTPVLANQIFASAIVGGLTNPSQEWFTFIPRDLELRDNENVMRWIDRVLEEMFHVFTRVENNFAQQNTQLIQDLGSYGTGVMLLEEDDDVDVSFKTLHLAQVYLAENSKGTADTVYRKFKFTARQAEQEWGFEDLPSKIQEAVQKSPNKEFNFLHCVAPKKELEKIDPSLKIKPIHKFGSVYLAVDEKEIVSSGGFRENPYVTPRWDVKTGEIYGRSPAWVVLNEIRMVNAMAETILRAAQKQVDPPLLIPDEGVIFPLQTFPGGINIGGVSEEGSVRIQPLTSGGRLDIGLEMLEQKRDTIRKAYFIDQFIDDPAVQGKQPLTATEALQKQENRLRLTGPYLERVTNEGYRPIIERVFSILKRKGRFPEVPEELEGVQLDIMFTGPLANTQKAQELLSYSRWANSIAPFVQFSPEIMDIMDMDSMARRAADLSGVPIKDIRSNDEVEALRAQREAALQQQLQQQQALELADKAATLQKSGINITGE